MDCNRKLTYCNRRIEALLNANETEDLFELFHTDMPAAVLKHMEKALDANTPWKGLVMIRYNGNHIEWEELYITRNESNGFIGFLTPADKETLLRTIFEYSSLKQHELSNRLSSHIQLKNLAVEAISA